ncbi:MAG: carboxypeptidase-like regulatory domain-containing protein [Chitinophagaceae bacterium]|nr:carboxypeptidase-like regulatory domain-containing protein [Chitinophagaceae bacterium]
MTDKVIIKGTVKEENSNPLQNAKVYMETIGDFFTNEKGEFTIEIDSAKQTSYTLYFSYEGLTTIVRNYHIAMQSTVYDITLHKPYEGWGRGSLGGAPIIEDLGELPSISFKSSSFILNSTTKALLSSISTRMKEHPDSEIKITAYGKTPKQIKLSHKRIASIKNYLEENEGISSDRLLEVIEEEGPSNIVDIK